MTQKVVLIDCDGVLVNFAQKAVEIAKEQFDTDIPLFDGKSWDLFAYPECAIVKDQIWDYMTNTPGIFYGLEKFDYADSLLEKLRAIDNVELIACTSLLDGPCYASERTQALVKKMGFDRKEIIITHRKQQVEGDFLIDDKPKNCQLWADKYYERGGRPILWLPPERKLTSDDSRFFMTDDIDEVVKFISSFNNVLYSFYTTTD